ncbi:hypothetical protein SEA_WEASELS2_164 [Rhodococcus phage Weasels2]|uniref:Uncharacterized protein n=1 Tax=Rhodococcus phage Weasels2 TaxID=1897437 RepID=A0A1I9SAD7_9CAUD|nr:hypothetical protein FDH04_gp251 [Rhodococcus phage Weasels2]AOZ63743.1 hypothetical protein SEA_WEASELS2_164 [Rhodococcus phage Weasels2]
MHTLLEKNIVVSRVDGNPFSEEDIKALVRNGIINYPAGLYLSNGQQFFEVRDRIKRQFNQKEGLSKRRFWKDYFIEVRGFLNPVQPRQPQDLGDDWTTVKDKTKPFEK